MRIVAHLISVALLVPGIIVSVALLGLSHLALQTSLLRLMTTLIDLALAFFPVAFAVFFLWLGLALMGFSTRLRRAGAIGVGIVAAATTIHIGWAGWPAHATETGIVVPGVCALVIAIWLASTDWADSAPGA
jgi:hypothetical protein